MKNKNITLLLLVISLLLLCGACKQTDNTYSTRIFRYVNESGVEVALVGETQGDFVIPDSLVLQNGEFFECSYSYSPLDKSESPKFPYKGYNNINPPYTNFPIKIYFNRTIRMTYYDNETNRDLRNPFYYGIRTPSYVKTTREEKHKPLIETINTYTYTFTAEDYQNALKAQE